MNTFVFILKDIGRYSDVATLFDNWCNGRFEVGFIDLDYNALDSGGPMQFLLEEMCHGNVDNAGQEDQGCELPPSSTVQTPFIDLRRAVLLQEPPSVPTLTGGGGGAREAAVIDPSDERLATMSLREQTALLSRQWHWRRARDLFDRMRALPGYAPNDIHYDIVIRHLAHACR
ncbi:Os03g0173800 [Oryza sativa Japonica Group]|uniref:Os03g0173800 protein n=1 Tax=Oryza sativa subsp. japonica TaxID=39947 RepID=A0A0P0VTN0_ORYSJ|nr:Os03g0173800 [Oryza sativa Japonica Group]